jgi:hypothetical protein
LNPISVPPPLSPFEKSKIKHEERGGLAYLPEKIMRVAVKSTFLLLCLAQFLKKKKLPC